MKSLRAIEENNFAAVPPGIFARSFIRSYAREVGIDPAAAIAEYRTMTEPVQERAPETKLAVDDDLRSSPFEPEFLRTSRPGWGYALIAAALLIAMISLNRSSNTARTEARAADVAATDTLPGEAPGPVATTGPGVRIEMRADGPCWIKVVADGQTVVARVLQPGEMQTISAQRDVVLRVGDPAALSYSINGRPGRALGEPRVPVTVRVGADGVLSTVS